MIYLTDDAAWEYAKLTGLNLYDPGGFNGVQDRIESLKCLRNDEIHSESIQYLKAIFSSEFMGRTIADSELIAKALLRNAHEDATCAEDLIEITPAPNFSIAIYFSHWMITQYAGSWLFTFQHSEASFIDQSLLDGLGLALAIQQAHKAA
jgi:hypothetical protein